MHVQNKLLVVGGATRNVGKTTFVVNIIKKFSPKFSVVALKIKTLRTNDTFFHGKDRNPLKENEPYRITEETHEGNEDTERMFSAGAERVFKIKAKVDYLHTAFLDFSERIKGNSLIVCESNSLFEFVKPDLFLFIKMKDSDTMKPSAKKLYKLADKVILSDGKNYDFDVKALNFSEKREKWELDLPNL